MSQTRATKFAADAIYTYVGVCGCVIAEKEMDRRTDGDHSPENASYTEGENIYRK